MVGKNFNIIYEITNRQGKSDGVHTIDILEALFEYDSSTVAPRGMKRSEKAKSIAMVQLCLLPIILDLEHNSRGTCHWDSSQRVVYDLSQKMFEGQYKSRVKLDFFLNTLNFFKFHLKTGNGEGILNEAYSKLGRRQCPQLWYGKVPIATQNMQGHWKGTWSICILLESEDIADWRSLPIFERHPDDAK